MALKRRLPDPDGGLVTVSFLFAEKAAGREWQIWIGSDTDVNPWAGTGWVNADGFLAKHTDGHASLVEAPSGLVLFARPKPKDW